LGKRYSLSHLRDQRYIALRDVLVEKATGLFRRNSDKASRVNGSPQQLNSSTAQPSSEDFWALKNVSFEVKKGEVIGIIGRNGAGKSTSIRIMLGLVRADSGSARLFGLDAWHDATEIHRRLAYVPGDVTLWPSMTGGECIDFLGRLRGGISPVRRADLLDRFRLDPSKKCKSYSKGNLQKVALVAAFGCDVELLLFDEPSSGLDPLMEAVFQECVRESAERGQTVLLSSHILSEVEALCDRISIVRSGTVIQNATLAQLRAVSTSRITLVTKADPSSLSGLAGVHNYHATDSAVTFDVEQARIGTVIDRVSELGIESVAAATSQASR